MFTSRVFDGPGGNNQRVINGYFALQDLQRHPPQQSRNIMLPDKGSKITGAVQGGPDKLGLQKTIVIGQLGEGLPGGCYLAVISDWPRENAQAIAGFPGGATDKTTGEGVVVEATVALGCLLSFFQRWGVG